MTRRRVVVTGRGSVCASGVGVEALGRSLETGESGVVIEGSDPGAWRLGPGEVTFAGRVSPLFLRRLDGTMRRALHAALQALDEAGLGRGEPDPRTGIVVGTGFAGSGSSLVFLRTEWRDGPEGADPSRFPNTVPNGPAGQLAIHLGAMGPGTNFFEAGLAGESAIEFARTRILEGDADAMVVCGVDERSEPVAALEEVYARAEGASGPEGALRPFDRGRRRTVFGEAAAALVLEDEAHAAARGARPLAALFEVRTASECSPPGRWPTDPKPYARALREAVEGAGLSPPDLAFVCAGACGSPAFDELEARAIADLLGPASPDVPVSASKGLTGDLSASAVMRAVIALTALELGLVPGTARLLDVDPALPIRVADEPLAAPRSRAVLVAGSGPGGCHAGFVLAGD